ncbi:5-carboxymethyl-2-hydroxymuconic-semialdehyde dehydrogenase [Salinibacterium amurskyense]|uniref:5-carboxymethyl-2-hydroxymuconic-semialdehyde dehydrogenase n=1 Tax=Salinibacterium amurskyense TaxID=205941 RepID=A0A2M9D3L5_9MICO|nr:aldehyde dehydrogenase [Salinibacterium amurskyense]PJJ78784.1 5-carboxymethyl-2-hydroxymuconic-semialdehyde dehydrogenase [Salinibacterium amurskyense]RLQ80853.1 betaine-aldehyde dehydrogenase [Salinibacterium amurskyense]GHD83649.1 aldehyde dehydrogenase [Salinibacterium amurskyense]
MTNVKVAGVTVDTRHFINGERVASDETFTNTSPIDASPLGEISRGGQREVDMAVAAARAAFPGWAATSPKDRAAIMHKIADLVEERVSELANVETMDNGALLRSHLRGVMPRVAHNFRFFADYLVNDLGHPDFETRGHNNHVSWDPSGVAALITPWNAPLMLATWKIAPALAAGDTVVLKPAEWTPLTASLFADITAEAGLPAGVFNVVQGYGKEAGASLVAHPDLSRISFTGSVPTAKSIARAAADNLTPCSFELGGKSPCIVMEDADLELAATLAVEQYDNAGQVCLSGTRILVHENIADAFAEAFKAKVATLRQGDPRDIETDIGPQVHRVHFERIKGFVDRAKDGGANIVFGGEPNAELGGLYFSPTLVKNPEVDSEIVTQEVFGPVLTMQTFTTDDELVAMANGTEFGLAAILVSGNREHADVIAKQLVAGTIWVNCFFVRDLRAPFGGSKKSGVGREGGTWSFDFYADVKNTVVSPNGWKE